MRQPIKQRITNTESTNIGWREDIAMVDDVITKREDVISGQGVDTNHPGYVMTMVFSTHQSNQLQCLSRARGID